MAFHLQRVNGMVLLDCYTFNAGLFVKSSFDTDEQFMPAGFEPVSGWFDIPLFEEGAMIGTIRYDKNSGSLWRISQGASGRWCTGHAIYEV